MVSNSQKGQDFAMKKVSIFAAGLVLASSMAIAHSKKEGTLPENGAVVANVPESIELRFNDGMRLVKVEMTYAEQHKELLDISEQLGFAKEISIPLVSMGSGEYVIDWRGLSVDGHPMNGSFKFEVK